MGMSLGGGSGPKAQINMTPMIDVLLVLIIIFLVITPRNQRGLKTLLPQMPTADQQPAAVAHDIVITVHSDNTVSLNQEVLERAGLGERLKRLFANGADQVIFVRGDKNLEFRQVAEVIDLARGAGVFRVGLMTN